jgi:hypothetical protein
MSQVDPAYTGFDLALREYLARVHPELQLLYEDTLQVSCRRHFLGLQHCNFDYRSTHSVMSVSRTSLG